MSAPYFQGQTITCATCSVVVPKRGATQKYCSACSAIADSARKLKWQSVNPRPDTRPARTALQKRLRARSIEASAAQARPLNQTSVADLDPDLAWHIKFQIPFDRAVSKNHIWSLSRKGGGHIFNRQSSNNYKNAIALMVAGHLRDSGIKPVQSKVWIDLFVQKPDHRSDAINVLDLVADGLKVGLGIDDRWFSIRMLDWEINKKDPKIYIGVGQESVCEVKSCSRCGGIKDLSEFHFHSRGAGTRTRVCIECSAIKPRSNRVSETTDTAAG